MGNLRMGSMVMPSVSIAGQEANQDQGQTPASKSNCGDIAVSLESTPKGGDHCGGHQHRHAHMETSSQRRFEPGQRWHASKQKGQGHAVHQTQSACRDPKAIPQAVTMAELFLLHGGASYN